MVHTHCEIIILNSSLTKSHIVYGYINVDVNPCTACYLVIIIENAESRTGTFELAPERLNIYQCTGPQN